MSDALVRRPDLGTVAWLEQTAGRLTFRDRLALVGGLFGALREGFSLGRRAKHSDRRTAPLALFEPPATPMVDAARAYLADASGAPMVNHCYRTAFWTMFVLHQHDALTPTALETAWVAALLHDVGLERPPAKGDFTRAGAEVVRMLAAQTRWPDEQVHFATEAIVANLAMRVDPAKSGIVAWAMNVGGVGEFGFRWHRRQMHPDRIAELEARYPRTDLRAASRALIRDESRRFPGTRFGFFRWVFPFILRL